MWFWVRLWDPFSIRIPTACFVLFLNEPRVCTPPPTWAPKYLTGSQSRLFFSAMANEGVTHLLNYQHGNMCYNFPKVPAVALNHLSNAEVSTDMFLIYFSFMLSVFVPPLFLYMWALHCLSMTWKVNSIHLSVSTADHLFDKTTTWRPAGERQAPLMKRVH